MQEPAAWKTLDGLVPFQYLLSFAQETRVQRVFVNDAFTELGVLMLILNQAERCAWKSGVHVEISGVRYQSEQVLHYFLVVLAWYCLQFVFFLLAAALSVYSGSREWSLSFKIFVCKIHFLPPVSHMAEHYLQYFTLPYLWVWLY